MKKSIPCLLAVLMIIVHAMILSACGKSESPSPTHSQPQSAARNPKPLVVVSNYPLQFMASQVAGDLIDLQYPVPAGNDPGYWKPAEADISLMQRADLILLNGAGHEAWLDNVTLDESKIVDTSKAFSDQYIETQDAVVHNHGDEGAHSHDGIAFTLWLDPTLARLQSKAILSALLNELPNEAETLTANYEKLGELFSELDGILDAFALNYKQAPIFASHPVYQYVERRCKLNLKSLHWEPGETPDEAAWAEFDALLAEHPAKWMLWEGEPTAETRKALDQRGVKVIVFPPFGNTPDSGDFYENMRKNYEALLGINAPAL